MYALLPCPPAAAGRGFMARMRIWKGKKAMKDAPRGRGRRETFLSHDKHAKQLLPFAEIVCADDMKNNITGTWFQQWSKTQYVLNLQLEQVVVPVITKTVLSAGPAKRGLRLFLKSISELKKAETVTDGKIHNPICCLLGSEWCSQSSLLFQYWFLSFFKSVYWS